MVSGHSPSVPSRAEQETRRPRGFVARRSQQVPRGLGLPKSEGGGGRGGGCSLVRTVLPRKILESGINIQQNEYNYQRA